MKYMLIMNTPRDGYAQYMKWPKKILEANAAFMQAFTEKLNAAGELVMTEGLAAPDQAKLVRVDKTGRLIPSDPRNRWQCIQWLFWQMAGLGPMAGQNHHFNAYAIDPIPYAIDRYVNETGRLYAVLDRQLRRREFIVDTYSIADIACYPWIQPERQKQNIDDFPDLKRWRESIAARPATQRAYAIAKTINVKPAISDEESRKILFGQGRHTVR